MPPKSVLSSIFILPIHLQATLYPVASLNIWWVILWEFLAEISKKRKVFLSFFVFCITRTYPFHSNL